MLISLILQVALLWFFINFFTRETDSSAGMRSAMIVVCCLVIARILLGFVGMMGLPIPWFLSIPIELAVLYYAVAAVCGHSAKTTLKICGAYLVTALLINFGMALLMTPVPV